LVDRTMVNNIVLTESLQPNFNQVSVESLVYELLQLCAAHDNKSKYKTTYKTIIQMCILFTACVLSLYFNSVNNVGQFTFRTTHAG